MLVRHARNARQAGMKGILLAGGEGRRLDPLTRACGKQLLPVYDKPMVYYPLSALMLAGLREVLVISTARDLPGLQRLLGDGRRLGMRLVYAEQGRPEGVPQAFSIARDFLAGGPAALALGDNLFYGDGLTRALRTAAAVRSGALVFAHQVRDPERYAVIEFDAEGGIRSLVEKPDRPRGNWVVPGLYFYGSDVCDEAAQLVPSPRGELEITDLNHRYLQRGDLRVERLGRGIAWFDAGTPRSLLDAAIFVAAVQERQGQPIACLEEIAWRNGWIGADEVRTAIAEMPVGPYAAYLQEMVAGGRRADPA